LEQVVGKRTGKGVRSLGFNAVDKSPTELEIARQKIISDVTHDDLLQFGLIPEFVGRLPIVSVLEPLDIEMMTMILTEPRNAVARQFQRLFAMDDIDLIFSEEARRAIAEEALGQKTGARGLRTVVEELLLDVMFELPSRTDVRKCMISEETVTQRRPPLLATESGTPVPEDESGQTEPAEAKESA